MARRIHSRNTDREHRVDEQVRRAAAGERVQHARHDVGAVDAAGEQHAELVREQQREDQDKARLEVAVARLAVERWSRALPLIFARGA